MFDVGPSLAICHASSASKRAYDLSAVHARLDDLEANFAFGHRLCLIWHEDIAPCRRPDLLAQLVMARLPPCRDLRISLVGRGVHRAAGTPKAA